MLVIIRTKPEGSGNPNMLTATVSIRDEKNNNIGGYPDINFSINTYMKISKDEKAPKKEGVVGDSRDDASGDQILLPINLFFKQLTLDDHKTVYDMYKFAKENISRMDLDNRREVLDLIQGRVFDTIHRLRLDKKMIAFCTTDLFVYPELESVGMKPHHSNEKTFRTNHYVEITGISILSKMMVPIWGDLIKRASDLSISSNQREKICFDLIEPTLEEGAFAEIYRKLDFFLSSITREEIKTQDKKTQMGTSVSYILSRNGVDEDMFDDIVMSIIVVKRIATYECFELLKDGSVPNAMVYIDNGIRKTTSTKIGTMREALTTMQRRDPVSHDRDDNSSILDYTSKTSKKSIDIPIFVTTAVDAWEIDKLLKETQTPELVYNQAVEYYATNSFDVSPLCQAMTASFIGTRFGGSKCIGYLPPMLYQKVVAIMQIWLIDNNYLNLAALVSSNTSQMPVEGVVPMIASRIDANMRSSEEYGRCEKLFRGFVDKPVIPFGRRGGSRKQEVEKIDFVNHIAKMASWLVSYTHSENMAPALWSYAKVEVRPQPGSDCTYDETIISDLCRFYLDFHNTDRRPF